MKSEVQAISMTCEMQSRRSPRIVYIAWVVQKKMFIILNAYLPKSHGTGAIKSVSESMFMKITKLDSP